MLIYTLIDVIIGNVARKLIDANICRSEHYRGTLFSYCRTRGKDQWTFFKVSIILRDNSLGRETRKNHLC